MGTKSKIWLATFDDQTLQTGTKKTNGDSSSFQKRDYLFVKLHEQT